MIVSIGLQVALRTRRDHPVIALSVSAKGLCTKGHDHPVIVERESTGQGLCTNDHDHPVIVLSVSAKGLCTNGRDHPVIVVTIPARVCAPTAATSLSPCQ